LCRRCSTEIPKCLTCNHNNLADDLVCETCDRNYYLYGNTCIECKETFQVIKGNICFSCSAIITSCQDCSKITENIFRCDSCLASHYLLDGNSDGFFEVCDKCNEKSKKKIVKDAMGRGFVKILTESLLTL
jgi:hypothetical protein